MTHSLAGLLLAEAAVQARPAGRHPPPLAFRSGAAAAAVVAANLPDADLLYTAFAADRFAYVLHHRGHTHTLPVAVLGGVLAWGVTRALLSRRAADPSGGTASSAARPEWRWLLGLLLVAVLSHLALDSTNSYGVHPFWPLDDRWYYGDALFIIEPWLWVAAVPPLLFASTRVATRVVLGLVLGGGLALAWGVSLVPWGAALALTAGAALSLALSAALHPRARVVAGLAGWALVTLVFVAATRAARSAVAHRAVAADSTLGVAPRLVDVVITPAVANPLCASAILVEAAGTRYRVATARVATLPALLPAHRCHAPAAQAPMLRASARPPTHAVRWEAEWDAPLAELALLARDNCEVAALLRFVRVPVWAPAGRDAIDVDDLRYAGRAGLSFAGFRVLVRPTSCPRRVPPWRPPRADLLARP